MNFLFRLEVSFQEQHVKRSSERVCSADHPKIRKPSWWVQDSALVPIAPNEKAGNTGVRSSRRNKPPTLLHIHRDDENGKPNTTQPYTCAKKPSVKERRKCNLKAPGPYSIVNTEQAIGRQKATDAKAEPCQRAIKPHKSPGLSRVKVMQQDGWRL